MKRSLILIISFFLISACSIPETKIYGLYIPINQKQDRIKNNKSIAIHVRSPRYLDQPYIAYRENYYELRISRYSKWESAPAEMVGNIFREYFLSERMFQEVTISHSFQEGMYNLEIDLKQFERYDEKDQTYGILAMNVTMIDPAGKDLFTENISRKISLDEKSFLSLARKISIALAEEVEKIQNRIRKELRNNL